MGEVLWGIGETGIDRGVQKLTIGAVRQNPRKPRLRGPKDMTDAFICYGRPVGGPVDQIEPEAAAGPRRGGRGRRPADEVRAEVLAAAQEVLHAEGMAAFTVERVASDSGASRTTIHKWWPTKGVLALEALFHAVSVGTRFPDTGDFEADLRNQLRAFARTISGTSTGRILAQLVGQAQMDPRLATRLADDFIGPRRELAIAAIEAARARGELHEDVDAEVAAHQLWGAVYYRLLLTPDLPPTEAFVDRLVDQTLRGLRA
jgi:AcrR family transcriptional regulator